MLSQMKWVRTGLVLLLATALLSGGMSFGKKPVKPPPEPEEALKKETAESLLRRIMTKEDETKINLVYILAVMLERKRILVDNKKAYHGQTGDDREKRRFQQRHQEDDKP